MESKTNYTLVGLTVLILTTALLSAALWLSVGFDRKKYDLYTVYMHEAATGLSEDSVVKFNGVKVGIVSKIELNQFDPQEVKILLKIEEGTPITASTQATLINQGITGATYLGLSAKSPTLFPLQKSPGEPYPVIPYTPSFFSQLEKNLNDISMGLKRILDKDNAAALKKSLSNLEQFTDMIVNNDSQVNEVLHQLPSMIHDLKKGINRFSTMAVNMSAASRSVSTTMAAGKVSIDKLSQQAIPPMVILLQRLNAITANLEVVSQEIRQNPAVIVRGSAPPKSGPGE